MIQGYSNKIANFFVKNKIIESQWEEVCSYGLELLISTVMNVLMILMISLAFGTLLEGVLFTVCFIIIRRLAGGYHADTHFGCIFIFSIVFFLNMLIVKQCSLEFSLLLSKVFGLLALCIVFFVPASEHVNRPLLQEEKEKFIKCSKVAVSIILFCIIIGNMFLAQWYSLILSASLGIFVAAISSAVAFLQIKIKNRGLKNEEFIYK